MTVICGEETGVPGKRLTWPRKRKVARSFHDCPLGRARGAVYRSRRHGKPSAYAGRSIGWENGGLKNHRRGAEFAPRIKIRKALASRPASRLHSQLARAETQRGNGEMRASPFSPCGKVDWREAPRRMRGVGRNEAGNTGQCRNAINHQRGTPRSTLIRSPLHKFRVGHLLPQREKEAPPHPLAKASRSSLSCCLWVSPSPCGAPG
jgi:hypothetical protein